MLIDLSANEIYLIRYILNRYLRLLAYTDPNWLKSKNVISSISSKFYLGREDNYEG